MTVTRSKKDRFLILFFFRWGRDSERRMLITSTSMRGGGGVGLTFNHSFKLLASSVQYFYYLHAFAISVME